MPTATRQSGQTSRAQKRALDVRSTEAVEALASKVTAEAGGAGLAPEELPDLLEKLKERADEFEEEIVETVTLWDSWPTLLTFVGLLSTEWFLRKRWGLV